MCSCLHVHFHVCSTLALSCLYAMLFDMQFGFVNGKGTTDAIFMARQMQENLRVKGKKLCFGFVDFWRKLLTGCQEK